MVVSVGRRRLSLPSLQPRSFSAEGKVAEIKELIGSTEATMAIFDNDLSPSQMRVLTEDLGVQVLDRSGLILDIFKEYGPDSLVGNMVSIMMGCTETVFYTMSVYFMSAHIRKTRWTLQGALVATAAGIAASIFLANLL